MALIAILVCIVFCIWLTGKLVAWLKPASILHLSHGDAKFCENLINYCPHLLQAYAPTPLWGFSGHLQTIVHSVIGRVHTHHRQSVRRSAILNDGGTLTWDEWSPLDRRPTSDTITLAVCPGIGNSSETVYIWSFVHYACQNGYQCIVLNHLGALKSVELTSPRIFGYGRTEELDVMLKSHTTRYPLTQLVLVGFSMGGNIITKYLGHPGAQHAPNILGAITICQGYDAQRCISALLGWKQIGAFYMTMMVKTMKEIVDRHRHVLFADDVKAQFELDEARVFDAVNITEFDEAYTRRVNGYDNVDELYRDNSAFGSLDGVDTPMIFINARDDPLVPPPVLDDVRRHCSSRRKTLFIETEHGGHLGFYEGGFLVPHSVTWLDRTVIQLANGLSKRN